jgi:hypothetical protein
MKRRWVGFGLPLLCVLVAGRSLLACGDKYFFTVQGTRYLLASLSKDSNILIYKNESSETSRLFSRIPVTGALSRAGFVTTVVTNESEFRKELATRPGNLPWTIIIAGSADAENFRAQVIQSGSVLLPVVDKEMTAPAKIKQIRDQYDNRVLNATPRNGEAFLAVVYNALVHRPHSQLAKADSH